MKTIRWVVAHFRDDGSFNALLQSFATRLKTVSEGRLAVEFVTTPDGRGFRDAEAEAAYRRLLAGDAEMAQVDVANMGALVAIQSPFLFRSYDHAEAVWTGPLGDRLLASVATETQGKLRGLAFSYSGGFRVLVGQTSIRTLEDFKGARIRGNGTSVDLYKALGVQLTEIDRSKVAGKHPIELIVSKQVDLEETEINQFTYFRRSYPEIARNVKFVNLTRHSMLVTSMVVNEAFFAGLSAPLRDLLSREVRALAVAERKLSVELARRNLETLVKEGHSAIPLAKGQEERLVAAAAALPEWSPLAPVIADIKAVAEPGGVEAGRLALADQA
jgi:TRAP-type C4-dicarboxylate transport system substrate-binding protein